MPASCMRVTGFFGAWLGVVFQAWTKFEFRRPATFRWPRAMLRFAVMAAICYPLISIRKIDAETLPNIPTITLVISIIPYFFATFAMFGGPVDQICQVMRLYGQPGEKRSTTEPLL